MRIGVLGRAYAACGAMALLGALGCSSEPPSKEERPPLEGQSVRVLVVDDPGLAAAVRDLEGAWKERSGALLAVEETTTAALSTPTAYGAGNPTADVVIYPSPLIGTLAQRQWLASLPAKALASQEVQWSDVFAALRTREATWDSRTVAVPLGSRVLGCFYRADLLTKFGKKPPQTWSDYQDLAQFFADPGRLDAKSSPAGGQIGDSSYTPAAEPLAEGWAGITLLARAAAYAKHRDYFTVLFNARTMEPRITGPPFVRALEELVAANVGHVSNVPADAKASWKRSPSATVDELLAGRCALAIGWPAGRPDVAGTLRVPSAFPDLSADGTRSVPATAKSVPAAIDPSHVGCVPLPGSRESFVWDQGRYEQGDLRRVPLLACEGRYASVTSSAEHPAAAQGLLMAVAAGDWGVRVSSASPATAVFRGSQLNDAERWTLAGSAVAAAYASAVSESLDTQEVVYALRIPGRDEYLAALDEAVWAAVSGKAKPDRALAAAADRWRAITQKLGVDAQRKACEESDVRIAF